MNRLKRYASLSFLLTAFITILLINLSCEDNPVTPNEPPPGSRDYTWTEHRIGFETDFITLNSIWAGSPTNVWTVGFGTSSSLTIMHFDGTRLKVDTTFGIQPNSVYGIDTSNIWIGTTSNSIWHYNGQDWYKQKEILINGYNRIVINTVWGNQEEVFAVGFAQNTQTNDYFGILLELKNNHWEFVDIPRLRAGFNNIRIEKLTGNLFISATNYDGAFIDKTYIYDRKKIYEIISDNSDAVLEEVFGKIYFVNHQKVFHYDYSNKQIELWKDFTGTTFNAGMIGKSKNDFFNLAFNGIGHYNGNDFRILYETNLETTGGWILEKDVFFCGTDRNTGENVLIHGKIKKE